MQNNIKNNVFGQILFVLILALSFLILYYTFYYTFDYSSFFSNEENMVSVSKIDNPTYSHTTCNYTLGDTLKKVLDANEIQKVSSDGKVHFVCGYDEIDTEINKINPKPDQRIHIIHNADYISAKDYLWNQMVINSGLERAKTMMPNTYILSNDNDRKRLLNEYKKGSIYIMKKNIQRQEGLKITDSLDEILHAPSSYVVVQELLQNPYTINVKKDGILQGERKTNMRFYILVVCKNDNMDVYVYNDGFMYYAKENWEKNNKNSGPNVTTGYIDRWIYDKNPLTQEDFRKYLDDPTRTLSSSEKNIKQQGLKLSTVIFGRIYNLLHDVLMSSIGKVCNGDKLRNNVSFQLFGADIAINDQLWPQIMELNKGPDLGAKDDRDGILKRKCTKDMLRIVGVVNNDSEPNLNLFINFVTASSLPPVSSSISPS